MSLYDKASLILPVSPAYKDGALQSYKPLTSEGTFTFSRGSNLAATRVDVNGLIEKGRENLVTYSNTFSSWTSINSTLTSNQAGYDGTNDAWLIEKTADAGRIQNNVVAGLATYSVYAKAGSASWLRLLKGANASAYFDLSNSTIGNLSLTIDATITSVGNGWYRCTITYQDQYAGSIRIYPALANNDTTGTSGNIYIQDAQLEQSLVATDYIETGATTAQAGILEDLPRLDYSGGATCPSLLLEPSRTNIIESSEYLNHVSWATSNMIRDANSAISPEGVQNAYKIIPTTASGVHILSNGTLGTATYSMFAKQAGYKRFRFNTGSSSQGYASFDLNTGEVAGFGGVSYEDSGIEDFGNGWYRCYLVLDGSTGSTMSIAVEDNNGSVSFAGDGTSGIYIYGAQCEASASYPTSYIPAYGTSVTRAADSCSKTGISSLIGQTEGTMFVEIDQPYTDGVRGAWAISDGSSTNRLTMNTLDVNATTFKLSIATNYAGGSTKLASVDKTYGLHKVVIQYSGTTLKLFVDGALADSVTTDGFGNFTNFYVGGNQTGVGDEIREIKQALLFTTALTDAECIALTTI